MTDERPRCLIADDQDPLRVVLQMRLQADGVVSVVAEAATGTEALEELRCGSGGGRQVGAEDDRRIHGAQRLNGAEILRRVDDVHSAPALRQLGTR